MLDGLSRTELKTIGGYIRAHRRENETVFAASNVAGMLYYHAGYVPGFNILFSPTVTSPVAPPSWAAATRAYLLKEPPAFIITQRGDQRFEQTGTRQTSEEALRSLPGIDSLLRSRYSPVVESVDFSLFQRHDR